MNKTRSHLHIFLKKLNWLVVTLNLHHPFVVTESTAWICFIFWPSKIHVSPIDIISSLSPPPSASILFQEVDLVDQSSHMRDFEWSRLFTPASFELWEVGLRWKGGWVCDSHNRTMFRAITLSISREWWRPSFSRSRDHPYSKSLPLLRPTSPYHRAVSRFLPMEPIKARCLHFIFR
jgi:hypothetical protein